MSDPTDISLNNCGCCEPDPTPVLLYNRPGLPALSYRIGTYATLFRRMLAELGQYVLPDGDLAGTRPLLALTTRAQDDPSIALLDASAVVADVLTFYQERIANEGFLRTATERRSILELARAIGYELNPGVAASVYLAFTIEDAMGAPDQAMIPAGTQVQSTPPQNQLPQTFETSADIIAKVSWNTLHPRLTYKQTISPSTTEVFLKGTATNLKAGDRILLFFAGNPVLKQVVEVEAQSDLKRTRLSFVESPSLPPFVELSLPDGDIDITTHIAFSQETVSDFIRGLQWTDSKLNAFLSFNQWDSRKLLSYLSNDRARNPDSSGEVYALRMEVGFFGNNAPQWKTLPNPNNGGSRGDAFPLNWDAANNGIGRFIWTDSQSTPYTDANVYLERAAPQILTDGWAVFECPGLSPVAYQIQGVSEKSLADYGLTGKSTGLTLKEVGNLDGIGPGAPSVAAWSANRLDAFARGLDGNLYHKWWNGSSWGGPENLGGGNFVSSPSAVAWSANRLDVFMIGSDGDLYHKWWNGSSWGGPQNLGGGNFVNSPSAVSWAADRLDVFMIGSDGDLHHGWWNGSSWGGPQNLGGGNFVDSPSAVSWAADRLDVFMIGSDGDLYHGWWNGSSWGGPQNLGGSGNLTSSPAGVAWSANRLDVFAIGSIGHWMHKWWDGGSWGGPEDLGDGIVAQFPVRATRAYLQSERLDLVELPMEEALDSDPTKLGLDGLVLGLTVGQAVILSGERSDAPGVTASEVLIVKEINHMGGFTQLTFETGRQYDYKRSKLTINANVALATHGATVTEILGSGDGSQSNQRFTLKKPPLTYTAAPTPSGAASDLKLRINNLLWSETPSLYEQGAKDQDYIIRIDDNANATVIFGDGQKGARLPTGANNVVATYRSGIGLAGEVDSDSLTILQSKPLGVRGVTNPLPASGAADPEKMENARDHAPLTVRSLDRIVSVDDYQDFASAFAGIGKAQAVDLWSGEHHLVYLTIAGADGKPVTDQKFLKNFNDALNAARDPAQMIKVDTFDMIFFDVVANIAVDSRYVTKDVFIAIQTALQDAFSFARRGFGQAVTAAEVITIIQRIAGVVFVDLGELYLTSGAQAPNQILTANTAYVDTLGNIQHAQLLLINSLGITLQEVKP